MGREQLRHLTEDKKLDLIVSLAARVAELEATLNRPKKTARSSSSPASQQPQAQQRQHQTKRGPKPGHSGKSRQRQEPNHTVECRVTACKHRGLDLPPVARYERGRS